MSICGIQGKVWKLFYKLRWLYKLLSDLNRQEETFSKTIVRTKESLHKVLFPSFSRRRRENPKYTNFWPRTSGCVDYHFSEKSILLPSLSSQSKPRSPDKRWSSRCPLHWDRKGTWVSGRSQIGAPSDTSSLGTPVRCSEGVGQLGSSSFRWQDIWSIWRTSSRLL